MKMSNIAVEYREMMRRGEIPPHNWDRNVSKVEKRKIYDAYVDYYIDLVNNGNNLPKRWPVKGLTDKQKKKIYDARGFASTDRLGGIEIAKKRMLKDKEKNDWLKSHGGQHTQDVMKEARRRRYEKERIFEDIRHRKATRRALSKFREWCMYRRSTDRSLLNDLEYRAYCRICNRRREEAERRKCNSWDYIKKTIIEKAKYDYSLVKAYDYIRDDHSWINEYVDEIGLFNTDMLTVNRLPAMYSHRMFDSYRNAFIGESVSFAIFLKYEMKKQSERDDLSKSIKRNHYSSSDSKRQLRALGFVA